MISKNSRVGRDKYQADKDCLPRYNPGNVGATWKTRGKYAPGHKKALDFSIKRKRRGGNYYA
jgi:hypothetical protein